jgi:hypothetical protein
MKVWFCCLILLLSLVPLHAQEAPNLLRNSGFEENLSAWFLKGADRVKTEFSVTSHEKFQRALRLDVTPQNKDMPWSVVLRQEIGAPLQKGKQLTLKAWLRSPEKMQVTAFVEGAKAPYAKTLTATITLTSEWQEYEIKSECNQDFAPGTANCGFYLSHGKGSIRLANVRLFQSDKSISSPKTETPKIEAPKTEAPKVETPKPVLPKVEPKIEAVLNNGDFTRDWQGWELPPNGPLQASISNAPDEGAPNGVLPAEWTRVLKLTANPPAPDVAPSPGYTISQTLAAPLNPGDGLSLRFWARGETGAKLGIYAGTLQVPNGFLRTVVDLAPQWKEYEVRGICGLRAEAGTARLRLHNAAADGIIELAGVRLNQVTGIPPGWADPPPVFNLQNLLRAEDFEGANQKFNEPITAFNLAGWQFGRQPGVTLELVEAQAGPYRNALRLTFAPPDATKSIGFGFSQNFRTPPLTGEVFAFKFWARSTLESSLHVMADQSEKHKATAPGEKPMPPGRRSILGATVPINADWNEYTVRPTPRMLRTLQQDPFPTVAGSCSISFFQPAGVPTGVVEITGFRLALERPAEPQ